MPEIRTACSACKTQFYVGEEFIGQNAACLVCNAVFTVTPLPEECALPPPPAALPFDILCPECGSCLCIRDMTSPVICDNCGGEISPEAVLERKQIQEQLKRAEEEAARQEALSKKSKGTLSVRKTPPPVAPARRTPPVRKSPLPLPPTPVPTPVPLPGRSSAPTAWAYYLSVWKKYCCFEGRASLGEFWWFALFNAIIVLVLMIIGGGGVFATIYILVSLLPALGVQVRRLHDTNKSGWFLLLSLIPYVGALILLYFFVIGGNKGDNSFGPDPTRS